MRHNYDYYYHRLRGQLVVLKDIEKEYPTSTVANAIMQISSRIKALEEGNKDNNV